jgi:hypothetical protein
VCKIVIPKTSGIQSLTIFSCIFLDGKQGFNLENDQNTTLRLFFEVVAPNFYYEHNDGQKYDISLSRPDDNMDWLFDDDVSAKNAKDKMLKDLQDMNLDLIRRGRVGVQIETAAEGIPLTPIDAVAPGEFQQGQYLGSPKSFELKDDP